MVLFEDKLIEVTGYSTAKVIGIDGIKRYYTVINIVIKDKLTYKFMYNDIVTFTVENAVEVCWPRIWNEIKLKYNGMDC